LEQWIAFVSGFVVSSWVWLEIIYTFMHDDNDNLRLDQTDK
jgi:hypothetical protein